MRVVNVSLVRAQAKARARCVTVAGPELQKTTAGQRAHRRPLRLGSRHRAERAHRRGAHAKVAVGVRGARGQRADRTRRLEGGERRRRCRVRREVLERRPLAPLAVHSEHAQRAASAAAALLSLAPKVAAPLVRIDAAVARLAKVDALQS